MKYEEIFMHNYEEKVRADERERILGMVGWNTKDDFKRRKLVVEIDYADVLNGEQVGRIIGEKLREQDNE